MEYTNRFMTIQKMRDDGKTLQEIGDYFGLTRERIRQILKRGPIPNPPPTESKMAYFIWYDKNLKIKNKANYRLKAKIECLRHYGRSCACCGETRKEFMTVDHEAGGGRKHRDSKQVKLKYGSMWAWLRHEGYPSGFRILCWNCNSSRGAFGYCPHEKDNHPQIDT